MQVLALHYDRMRRRYPDDKLLILFDIDGTIIDMRHLIRHVLRRSDAAHGTNHFKTLEIGDITVHENHIKQFLAVLDVPQNERAKSMDSWLSESWSSDSLTEVPLPFKLFIDSMLWFPCSPL